MTAHYRRADLHFQSRRRGKRGRRARSPLKADDQKFNDYDVYGGKKYRGNGDRCSM